MQQDLIRSSLRLLLSGLLLTACSSEFESGVASSSGEPLGTVSAAVCSNSSVTSLTISSLSTELGEMAGNGGWAVSAPANGVRLEYYIDDVLQSVDERCNSVNGVCTSNFGTLSGSWYFSKTGVSCGPHTFKVKAYAMVIDSAGSRAVCYSNPSKVVSQSVSEPCPTVCGNYICEAGENSYSCPRDCCETNLCSNGSCCGNTGRCPDGTYCMY